MRPFAAILLMAASPALFAQSAPALSGCEPRPEVRQILDEKLSEKALREMKFAARVAFRRQVLEDLIAQYPREVEPYRRLLKSTKDEDTDQYPALVDRFRKQAEQHPDDALALYLAGLALSGIDTPQSIRFLEQARSKAPDFPWPALALANIYAPGAKRADKNKAGDELSAFFAACPSSTASDINWPLGRAGSSELQARVAVALRARLATETDLHRLEDYKILWGLEFRTHPPQQHDTLRKQVTADLQRLESLNPKPDAAWLVFLKDGYQQSDAQPATPTAMEDRIIQAFSHSDEAYRIVRGRWEKSHPEPEDQKDAAAWAKYHAQYRETLKVWLARFTESRELQHVARFEEFCYDPDAPPEESLRALDDYLAELSAYEQPTIGNYLLAAEFLVEHKWQPRRVFDLLRNWDKLVDQWHARMLNDNLPSEAEEMWAANDVVLRQAAAVRLLVAAKLAEQPGEVEWLKPFVKRELPPKTWPIIETRYWLNRGRLAVLEGSKADALTYYQKALQTRKDPPAPFEGHVHDDLIDEARALWQQLGGTETAWNLWSKPPASKIQALAESGWQKPTKPMPPFELADLSGKTWRLKALEGRAVLINVWATWCGPCKAELPHLEKLYEKVKDRPDLQILTLTIDEDLGAVAPFMKEKGYTFPVLPAYSFVTGLLDLVGIPQNWIVDTKGEWRWTGAPGVPDGQWEDAMLKQLESAK